jgi:penicillin amidase
LRWVAQDEDGVNLALGRIERARTLTEAQEAANLAGAPAQNFVAVDKDGHIGWTILGRIPRRVGFDGMLPGSWADGKRRWDGFLEPSEYPRVVDPPSGRIWTANSRVVDGERLEKLGFGGYDLGARAKQIRDDLLAIDKATPEDMLKVQIDDRALFLARWRELLLGVLTPERVAEDPRRAEMRAFVESWGGRASVDSVGYRLVRDFRTTSPSRCSSRSPPCKAADPRFRWTRMLLLRRAALGPRASARSTCSIRSTRPGRTSSWPRRRRAAAPLTKGWVAPAPTPDVRGRRNTAVIRHPFLRAPLAPLPRHAERSRCPATRTCRGRRDRTNGAERLAVSPGREAEGSSTCRSARAAIAPRRTTRTARAWVRASPAVLPGPPAKS